MATMDNDFEPTELNIAPEKVCYIISKAREFDMSGADRAGTGVDPAR